MGRFCDSALSQPINSDISSEQNWRVLKVLMGLGDSRAEGRENGAFELRLLPHYGAGR